MKADAERMKEEMGDKRREDKAIAPFTIEVQDDFGGDILTINTI